MNLECGEIVLIEVPFHQAGGAKIRPAVVILDSADEDFLGAPITSRSRTGTYEISIVHWQSAGLNAPSTARIHKVAVLPKMAIKRRIGTLTLDDLAELQAGLCREFCPPST